MISIATYLSTIMSFYKYIIMNKLKILFSIIVIISIAIQASAQTAAERKKIIDSYDEEKIQALETYLDVLKKNNKQRFEKFQSINNWPETITTKDGTTAYLIGVSLNGEPNYVSTMNEEAAQMQGARELQTGGFFGVNMEGQGMTVGVWDGGKLRDTHLSYVGRTVEGEFLNQINGHATHVAGTIGSNGIGDITAKGIAPQVTMEYFKFQQSMSEVEDEVEMSRAASRGLLVSNHSYGIPADRVSIESLGKYDLGAQAWDQVAYTYPFYLIVSSAGNSRTDGVNTAEGGYDLLTSRSNAKNNLVVGATIGVANYTGPSSVGMSRFSSWGPTDDGRVKPDISTKGVAMFSTSDVSDTQYVNRSGTSMSSPAVAGGAIILQQFYNSLKNNYMKAASLKGLILHSAYEAGSFPGPDYRFGWGLMNTEEAAHIIEQDGTESLISELTLNQGSTYSKSISANGSILFSNKLTISISWTDPAVSDANLPSAGVNDDRTPMLVNDLDIVVTDQNGVSFLPWKLDPNFPTTAATTGVNSVDNFEKIEIDQPLGNYTISISHKGTLLNGSQDYSLIISGADNVTLSNDTLNLQTFELYPNPANDFVNIAFNEAMLSKDITIAIYDVLGKRVFNELYTPNGSLTKQIDTSIFKDGIYLVRIGDGSSSTTKKLIIK